MRHHRHVRIRHLVVGVLAVCALCSCSGDDDGSKQPIVRFLESPPVEIRAGEERALTFEFEIAEEHHIQANPAAQDNLIPAQLELRGTPTIEIGTPAYPPGHTFVLEGSDWNLSTYDGRITIEIPVRVTSATAPGSHHLQGTFSFQACNRRSCLRPSSVPIAVALNVSGDAP